MTKLSKEAEDFINKNKEIIEALASGEKVVIDKKPSDALLVSMALRQNHAFGIQMPKILNEENQNDFKALYPTED